MRFSQSSKWHHEIDETANRFIPTSFSPPNNGRIVKIYFPFAELQQHTSLYLKRKGSNLEGRERHLISLVKDHGRKDVAIAACAQALSRTTVRSLLFAEFQFEASGNLGILQYLRAITAAHHANPNAVSDVEALFAQNLLLLSSPQDPALGRYLSIFFSDLSRSERSELISRVFIDDMVKTACRTFAMRLDSLKDQGSLKQAHEEALWLAGYTTQSPAIKCLLNVLVPNWRIWALWRPNSTRLSSWESLLEHDRKELKDMLVLEGPDFTGHEMPTLRQGIVPIDDNQDCSMIRCGQLMVKPENGTAGGARMMLNRLLDAIDAACSSPSGSMDLFIHTMLCGPIDAQAIQLLQLVATVTVPHAGSAVLKLLTSDSNSVKASAAMQLLPFLGTDEHELLRETLTPHIVQPIQEEVARAQTRFCEQLQTRRNVDGMVTKLYDFFVTLEQAPWLQSLLCDQLQFQLRILPEKNDLLLLFELRNDIQKKSSSESSMLPEMIDATLRRYLAGYPPLDIASGAIIEALLKLWKLPLNDHLRTVAVALVERRDISAELCRKCLTQLEYTHERIVHGLGLTIRKETDMNCVNFARILAAEDSIEVETFRCWRDLLLCMIKRRDNTLLDYTLTNLDIPSWFNWLEDLRRLFDGIAAQDLPTIVLQSSHPWNEQLSSTYMRLLVELKSDVGLKAGLRMILAGWEDSTTILPALDILQGPSAHTARYLLKLLAPDGSNGREIYEVLSRLNGTTRMGTQAYLRVIQVYQSSTIETAEAVLAVWLQSSDLTVADVTAIEALAPVLGIRTSNSNMMKKILSIAAVNLENEFSDLVENANRLESILLSLRADNAAQTSALLARIGIENLFSSGEAHSDVPPGLINVVERVGDREYEMSYLLTHLKPLNRIALGVGDARILIVRLILPDGSQPPKYCVHLHPEQNGVSSNQSTSGHKYLVFSPGGEAPDVHLCHGRATRATYQIGRALWRSFDIGMISLESLYNSLANQIEKMARYCIICGRPIQGSLWRSTTCERDCSLILKRSNLEIRLADIRIDPPVVDLLLSTIYAAALNRPELSRRLLTGCPVDNTIAMCQSIANIPDPSTLQNVKDLTAAVGILGPHADTLLSWVCTSYRGFLATPTEALRIPSMPGAHQFILVNAAPELEQRFGLHSRGQNSTKVVFHGTSLDRLYSILVEGITVQSGSPLERHGSAMGRGIYLADEPAVSLGYASGFQRGKPSPTWDSRSFRDVRVLLGCELAGQSYSTRGSHVIVDPSRVMVRYIFLFPCAAIPPIAAHVVPALTSAFATLRSGLG